jgi:hypothetical protein
MMVLSYDELTCVSSEEEIALQVLQVVRLALTDLAILNLKSQLSSINRIITTPSPS